jgi:hypothetical protein
MRIPYESVVEIIIEAALEAGVTPDATAKIVLAVTNQAVHPKRREGALPQALEIVRSRMKSKGELNG